MLPISLVSGSVDPEEPAARALHIICVMVPMGQYTHQERGRNIDHFLAEAACVRPGVRATAEELEETERWERELVALMKEEEAQQDRT